MDAFSAQIVKFVRAMPDDALLELVKQKLGILGAAAARSKGRGKASAAAWPTPARAPGGAARSTKGKRAVAPSRRRPTAPPSAERQGLLDAVERVVKAGAGLSASDVAGAAGIPQTRAAAALKELKLTKRIFQGGDRRFARYAGDPKTAEQASQVARKNAKGPAVRAKPSARARKRPAPPPATPAG
jgi:hypothetical protein